MSYLDHHEFLIAARRKCEGCRDGADLPVAFTMAFQPIVRLSTQSVWGYEALVRGPAGESARSVLDQIGEADRYTFDQACRVRAIELAAARLPDAPDTRLSINFKPNAVYEPAACIRQTLAASARSGFDSRRLMFEFTEDEPMRDAAHVRGIAEAYRKLGFLTAIDDFGAGYAGLALVADLHPDVIKLDMHLLRGIDGSARRRAIVAAVVAMARELDIVCLAEGLETASEVAAVQALGIDLCQGYYFARPQTDGVREMTIAF